MAEKLDVDEMRATFQRVAVYREVCKAVRGGAGHTFFNGVLYLGLVYFFSSRLAQINDTFAAVVAVQYALGVTELLVGVWKRLRPSPEAVLVDGVVLATFGSLLLFREYLLVQHFGFRLTPVSLIFGAWFLWDAVRAIQAYTALRRMFIPRPTADHLAYVDELVREIRASDPESDPRTLDLPTFPHLKAKLLGDLAIIIEARTGAAVAAARDDVVLEREESLAGRLPTGFLRIDNQDYPEFGLSAANWRNYAQWKTEGGDPPPPVRVRPAREPRSDD